MNVLNEFVALTTRTPPRDPLAAGMNAATREAGLKPIVWRDFELGLSIQADAHVGLYELEVRVARDKGWKDIGFRWSAGSGGYLIACSAPETIYPTPLEAKLAAEAWLRGELMQYIPYCIPHVKWDFDDLRS